MFGVDIQDLTFAEAVDRLDRFAELGVPTRVAFANAHLLNVAWSRADVRSALADFFTLPDGIGADIAKWVAERRIFQANLNGTDFVPAYLLESRLSHRIFLLGAREGIAERTAARLRDLDPRLQIVGYRNGFFDPRESADIAAAIRASGADLLLVGMGNPTQELWIAEHAAGTGCRLAIGVGALFDFLSGDVPRAPALVRRFRFEWLYRLAMEPRRLAGRYLRGNCLFLLRVARDGLHRRRAFTDSGERDRPPRPPYSP